VIALAHASFTGSHALDMLACGLAAFVALTVVTRAAQWLSDWWNE
jgi:hypothetical protein